MSAAPLQPSFDDLGTPLPDVTFCVVDLETTGTSSTAQITEIGAVKVCGGHVEGEYQTLVRPSEPISASVQVLTGITNAMVLPAPPLAAVLPSWSEFSRGTVLVAHNARFDVGFLKKAYAEYDYPWENPAVVDTLTLARSVLSRAEVRNYRLGTLSQLFRTTTTPSHRALEDARATVDVLHGLIERVGNLGVTTLEDLLEMTHRVSPTRQRRRVWAKDLPERPGVYWFCLDKPAPSPPEVLYVGKSVNIRRRVSQYFTASETRRRMDEMVRVATGVKARECSTALEAGVRELRLIDAHQPRYNRRSRRQGSVWWVALTDDAHPRLSVIQRADRGSEPPWGPFTSRRTATLAATVLAEAFGLRQCSGPLSRHSDGCPLAEMGRCSAPCLNPDVNYSAIVDRTRRAMTVDVRELTNRLAERIARLSDAERFEDAAEYTDNAREALKATRRRARLSSLASCHEIVAARREGAFWEIHVIRHGRLAGAGRCRTRTDPMPVIDAIRATAETVTPPPAGLPACTVEEAELVASWFEEPGVRLVDVDGEWSWPANCWVPSEELAIRVSALHHPGDDERSKTYSENRQPCPDLTTV
ncbi:DEDD exonuclease domain-containing protein [Cutibacterium sp.]|uniref:DEDD exonuclease domain-containing protein n=1 Tax=Cutibacterium sp. TaxID=1912221 RepID=UPI0026DCFC74|nr:DEDD exonuclease domain-containing protein [Cutibacterium sp.]MDO4411608.1 DEDD exonuclease domain-containing protein [Cutibacterium sp.]